MDSCPFLLFINDTFYIFSGWFTNWEGEIAFEAISDPAGEHCAGTDKNTAEHKNVGEVSLSQL